MDGQQFLVENARRKASVDVLVVEQLKEIFHFWPAPPLAMMGTFTRATTASSISRSETGADTIGVNAVQADLPPRHAPRTS